MKTLNIIILLLVFSFTSAHGQSNSTRLKTKKYKTSSGIKIQGQEGYLSILENRSKPGSRSIKVKFVRLKSLSTNPQAPVIYLEGGGQATTWQVDSPKDLNDWLPILQVSDLIFYDQRGTTDRQLTHVWQGDFPKDVFTSAKAAKHHYQAMTKQALQAFQTKGIDVSGYTVVEHAQDVQAIAKALDISEYAIFGFSFGTHIGMTLMQMSPNSITNAVLISADAPDQSFNYPSHLDQHFEKVAAMVAQDSAISKDIPDLQVLLTRVMGKLENKPVTLTIRHPLTGKEEQIDIGSFGLNLILRLDIDDSNDIPIIPRLLYNIDQGDYSLLQWFVQKRVVYILGLPGNGINQALASGASPERWTAIQEQVKRSQFGDVVNFPFNYARDLWPMTPLGFDITLPIKSSIRTLFVTGNLDARTPISQVEKTMEGFTNAIHLKVKNAGHEQAKWNVPVFDETIPAFLLGKQMNIKSPTLRKIKFIPLTGPSDQHPALK